MRTVRKRPTIHEVARLAGVSIGTVSNVLNDSGIVRLETRVSVEKAIADLGYRPNTIARSLIARRTRISGAIAGVGPKLTTIGYLSVDYTARVRALPRPDDRVTAAGIEKSLGGPAANVAVMAAGLGGRWTVRCELITALGDDADSEWALAELAARNVDAIGIRGAPNQRLSRCIVVVEPNGSRTIINEPFALEESNVARYLGRSHERQRRHCVHLDGYQVAGMVESIRQVRDDSLVTSVQTTGLRQDWRSLDGFAQLRNDFDLVFLNRDVARDTTGFAGSDTALVRRVKSLCARTVPADREGLVLLTLGASGAAVFRGGGGPELRPAPVVKTVDTTGAGDTFAGVFLAAWLNGEPWSAALRLAVAAASLSVGVEGAQGLRLTADDLARYVGNDVGVERPLMKMEG